MSAKIVIPLDGSPLAERSLSCLGFVRSLGEVSIDLVRVRESPDEEASTEEMQEYLSRLGSQMEDQLGKPVDTTVLAGVPFLAILGEAESEDVSMVVIATHGRTGVRAHGVGSVTDRLVRYAPCPTLVLSPSCSEATNDFERLVVPLDGSPLAEEALVAASTLAHQLGKPVVLIRVVASDTDPSGRAPSNATEAEARRYLRGLHSRFSNSVELTDIVGRGPVIETLVQELMKQPGSLLVMSAHGAEGYRSYELGRVSDDLLLSTPVPVLLVGPGQAQRLARAFGG